MYVLDCARANVAPSNDDKMSVKCLHEQLNALNGWDDWFKMHRYVLKNPKDLASSYGVHHAGRLVRFMYSHAATDHAPLHRAGSSGLEGGWDQSDIDSYATGVRFIQSYLVTGKHLRDDMIPSYNVNPV